MNNSRLMIVNQQTQPKSLQDLSQMTQNNKLQDKQKVSKIFLPQLKPKKTLRNIMHSNGRPNIGISQDTSKLSMLDQSSLNNTLAFPSHDISKYSSYNPQASQQQLKTQNSPSKMLLYKSSSQYRIAPMSDKHILEKKMELYTSLERRKQFFESYIKFNPNQPEMRRNLSSLNGLKQTQQEIILETAFQNNQKQDGRHDSPLKSKNMMSQLQSYKRGISSLNKDLVILQQQQTQNDAMNNGKVQPFSPLNSQYPFKPVITESNFLKNHHHSNKQSIDFNRDYQNQGVNNVNQTNLLPKVSSHRQLMPLGQFQQNNQNMMEQSAYLSQNHLTQLQNSQNLSTDNQSPNQTLIQQKLKRKKKKGDLDSISSFDSELEENRKDAHLMITKKNRKDLEGFNDRMWEKSLEMEKVMDLIMQANKVQRKLNKKRQSQQNQVFSANSSGSNNLPQNLNFINRQTYQNSKHQIQNYDQLQNAAMSSQQNINEGIQVDSNGFNLYNQEMILQQNQMQRQYQSQQNLLQKQQKAPLILYKINNYQFKHTQDGLNILNQSKSNQQQQQL